MIGRVVTYDIHFHSTLPHFKSMHKNEQMLKAPNPDQTITNMKQMSTAWPGWTVVVEQRTSGPREQDRVEREGQQPESADGDCRLRGGPQQAEHGHPRMAGRRHQRVPVPAEQTAGVDTGCC